MIKARCRLTYWVMSYFHLNCKEYNFDSPVNDCKGRYVNVLVKQSLTVLDDYVPANSHRAVLAIQFVWTLSMRKWHHLQTWQAKEQNCRNANVPFSGRSNEIFSPAHQIRSCRCWKSRNQRRRAICISPDILTHSNELIQIWIADPQTNI